MTVEEKGGQLFYVNCRGNDMSDAINEYHIGGVLLFGVDFDGNPVFVYGFGAIFGKITAIEPPKISRSISDRVDYPPIRLSCFGIISVSVRQFSPVSFLP